MQSHSIRRDGCDSVWGNLMTTFIKTFPLLLLTLGCVMVTGCATPVKPPTPDTETREPALPEEWQRRVDVDALQRALGLSSHQEDLGIREKAFNTCEVGYGYSSTHHCRTQYLTVLHFRLECRDSEGTISETDYSVRPIHTQRLRWNLGPAEATIATNSEGYGRIRWIFPASQRHQRVRITVDGQFLTMRANDLKRVVVPGSWCKR
jgi:hypothetical protein